LRAASAGRAALIMTDPAKKTFEHFLASLMAPLDDWRQGRGRCDRRKSMSRIELTNFDPILLAVDGLLGARPYKLVIVAGTK
jgi:hypothetical protein